MIHGVIFDLGSTLIRFTGDWPQVFEDSLDVLVERLEQEGLSFPHDVFREDFSSALNEYHQQRDIDLVERTTEVVLTDTLSDLIGRSPSKQLITSALEGMYRVSQDHWHPLPDAHLVLDRLHDRNLRLGLISNASDEADVQRLIDKANLRDYLDPIIVSAGFGLRKPHPDIFNAVLNEWQFGADRVVMIGDLLEADILGAEQVGMRHIWMTEAIDEVALQPPYPVEPDVIASRLAEVPGILEAMERKGNSS